MYVYTPCTPSYRFKRRLHAEIRKELLTHAKCSKIARRGYMIVSSYDFR